eukprot:m.1453903 g.1453903  ORF g.1453903 m.1453903 type:complete len:51 (-) comp25118_c1_seq3:3258-3410(-)
MLVHALQRARPCVPVERARWSTKSAVTDIDCGMRVCVLACSVDAQMQDNI